jgi:dephospho-CoA kinase
MSYTSYNKILNREHIASSIKKILIDFEKNKQDLSIKRGIYICGAPGSGKTHFAMNVLSELNYDIIKYDAGDVRNKTVIENIAKNNMSDKNVFSILKTQKKSIAIVMDEIDGMNNGDKGGINSLIKIIRPKKTKKQKLEEIALTPIICVSSFHVDKKIKELMKVCHVYELQSPNAIQMKKVIDITLPGINNKLIPSMINYLQYDLRKLNMLITMFNKNNNILSDDLFENILKRKSYNEDTKEITQKIFNNDYSINTHTTIMNDTDRTIVGLLWHENVIDILNKMPANTSLFLYKKMLDKICFADYIDRITFQKQIWQFNEMSSLIKTFSTNSILHKNIDKTIIHEKLSEIRFTKVLTKYSTEYNNSLFIQELCQKLSLDKKDMFSFFIKLKSSNNEEELCNIIETYEITKLDINRIYRYIDKYTNDNYVDSCNKNSKNTDIDDYDINEINGLDTLSDNSYGFLQ